MKINIFMVLLIAVITCAIGFYGGREYQKSQNVPNQMGQAGNTNTIPPNGFQRGNGNMPSGGANFQGNRPVSGKITSIDNNSITIKLQDGSSKIVVISDQTKISKTSDATASDLKAGTSVTVFGSQSSDGTVTADTVSIGNGMMQGLPGRQAPGQNEQLPAGQ